MTRCSVIKSVTVDENAKINNVKQPSHSISNRKDVR